MLLIKAGGSALTDKSIPYSFREPVVHALAGQLRRICEPLILAHGVGSFGHPPAKQYRIGLGDDATPDRRLGLAITQYWVDELAQRVIKILIDARLPALLTAADMLFVTEDRRIVDFHAEPIQRCLTMNLIPVLHGDGPLDRRQGFSVLSADQIVIYLARFFTARKVIFAMDVPGILRNGRPIPRLSFRELPTVQKEILSSQDASGGLAKKLEEIGALAGTGIDVQLVSLLEPDALLAAAHNQERGTLISDQHLCKEEPYEG
ncbi:MAG TPA: isopentenyl phosphate kinase [bacterium]|nr:isopentenyl phosphate kinase [bacterium]HPN34864.1 isopentenyl phosphate kinase [bacterium]